MAIMKTFRPAKLFVNLVVAALVTTFVAGCAWSIGGSEKGETTVHPSKGQELLDLKRARDAGALSDAEYEVQKERILNK
jgi:hypothetical protein